MDPSKFVGVALLVVPAVLMVTSTTVEVVTGMLFRGQAYFIDGYIYQNGERGLPLLLTNLDHGFSGDLYSSTLGASCVLWMLAILMHFIWLVSAHSHVVVQRDLWLSKVGLGFGEAGFALWFLLASITTSWLRVLTLMCAMACIWLWMACTAGLSFLYARRGFAIARTSLATGLLGVFVLSMVLYYGWVAYESPSSKLASAAMQLLTIYFLVAFLLTLIRELRGQRLLIDAIPSPDTVAQTSETVEPDEELDQEL